MNKKICSLICFMLILGAIIPVASTALTLKPDKNLKKIILELDEDQYTARPPKVGRPGKPVKLDYELLGIQWPETPVTYYIDPSDLDEDLVKSAISTSAEAWDEETSAELFNDIYTVIDNGSWDDTEDELDGRNELVFDDYDNDGVIAVCIIWFDIATNEIVEFDIMFNTDFTWGDADVNVDRVMDLQNIATHELGHGVGLGDLYKRRNSDETMYGSATWDETKKRTLESGDIAGIQALYGS